MHSIQDAQKISRPQKKPLFAALFFAVSFSVLRLKNAKKGIFPPYMDISIAYGYSMPIARLHIYARKMHKPPVYSVFLGIPE